MLTHLSGDADHDTGCIGKWRLALEKRGLEDQRGSGEPSGAHESVEVQGGSTV